MTDPKIWKTASKFNMQTVSKIEKMTDRNLHAEALIEAAKMLGYKHLQDKLELVMKLHKLEGHLPHPLAEYRHILYEALMKAAKQDLTPDEFERFYRAF